MFKYIQTEMEVSSLLKMMDKPVVISGDKLISGYALILKSAMQGIKKLPVLSIQYDGNQGLLFTDNIPPLPPTTKPEKITTPNLCKFTDIKIGNQFATRYHCKHEGKKVNKFYIKVSINFAVLRDNTHKEIVNFSKSDSVIAIKNTAAKVKECRKIKAYNLKLGNIVSYYTANPRMYIACYNDDNRVYLSDIITGKVKYVSGETVLKLWWS